VIVDLARLSGEVQANASSWETQIKGRIAIKALSSAAKVPMIWICHSFATVLGKNGQQHASEDNNHVL